MSWRVVGIDASPANTGICTPEGDLSTWKNALKKGEPTARRLLYIDEKIRGLLAELTMDGQGRVDLAVVEGYNYGLKKFGDVFGIGEAAGVIKLALAWYDIPVVSVTPNARAQFATTNGGADKRRVLAEWGRITGVEFGKDDNQADAHVLREVGLHLLGTPTYDLSRGHLEALTKVRENPWNAAVLRELLGQSRLGPIRLDGAPSPAQP